MTDRARRARRAGGRRSGIMGCERSRLLVSLNLDGEASEQECLELADHLVGCPACRSFAADAAALHRSWRVAPAPEVPDLTGFILARGAPVVALAPPPAARRMSAVRVTLAAVAVVQVLQAAPEVVRFAATGDELAALHHLNAWAVAFALGLVVVAVQPWRARGLLPLATALAALMSIIVGVDLVNGREVVMPATTHAAALAGTALLWILARSRPGDAPTSPRRRRRWPGSWRFRRPNRCESPVVTAASSPDAA